MDKLNKPIALGIALMAGLTANAQLQLQNADFEHWKEVTYSSKTGEEPTGWTSFLSGTGSMKNMAANVQLTKDSETLRPGTTGQYSAKLTSRSILGVVAQGNLTSGTINMGSMTANDASGNYNYVSDELPGHPICGHPDAFRVWVKYNSSAGKVGQARALLVTSGYYQDPVSDKNPNTATLVAIASNTSIASSDEWQELVIPFEWQDTDAEPCYALVNVATCSTPGGGHKDDVMWVDDIELLYYSELASISYDGIPVEGNVLPCTPKMFGEDPDTDKLVVTSNGRGATIRRLIIDGQLHVTIFGEDTAGTYMNYHNYTYDFAPVESNLLSLSYDGQAIEGDVMPCLQGDFNPELLSAELSAGATYIAEVNDEGQLVITVLDENGENPTVSVYSFVTVGSELLSLSYNGTPVYGTVLPYHADEFDATLLTWTISDEATIEVSEVTADGFIITVKGKDIDTNPTNQHIYTYTFDRLLDISAEPIEVAQWSDKQKFYVANMAENGACDMTTFIANPSFEEGAAGWTIDPADNTDSNNGFVIGKPAKGMSSNCLYVCSTGSNASIPNTTAEQMLTDMLAGAYTLKLSCISYYYSNLFKHGKHTSHVSLGSTTIDVSSSLNSAESKTLNTSIDTDGDMLLKLWPDASSSRQNYVQFDNFTLSYTHPNYKVLSELMKYDALVAEKQDETFTNMYNNMVADVRATAWELTDNSEKAGEIAAAYEALATAQHCVAFVVDGVATTTVLTYGDAIIAPADPEKEGYTFKGWDAEIATTMGMTNLTYTAQWEVNSYTLAYSVDGEPYGEDETVAYGTELTLREAPEKEGYTFSGWSELPATMPAQDVTVTGTFTINQYTVKFVDGEEVVKEETLDYGTTIVAPEAPEKEGYTFAGWGEVAETVPAADVTYTAQWTVNSYNVNYIIDEETIITVAVNYGEALPEAPAAPEKEGYTFAGWSEAPESMPAQDVTITGSYTVNIYTVIWTVNDVEVYRQELAYGEKINAFGYEMDPYYTYSGWEGYTNGMTMPAHDVTFNQTSTIVTFTITYMVGDEVYQTVTLDALSQIELIDKVDGMEWKMADGTEIPDRLYGDIVIMADPATAIAGVDALKHTDAVYTLTGVKVTAPLAPGVYIRGGKKFRVK